MDTTWGYESELPVISKSASHLVLHRNTYYFRRAIPVDLHPFFGRSELRLSLGTSYLKVARALATHLSLHAQELFRRVRETTSMQELTEAQIRALAQAWLHEALEKSENDRLLRDAPLSDFDIDVFTNMQLEVQDIVQEDLVRHDFSRVAETAEEVLLQNGVTPDRSSLSFRKLCRELLKTCKQFLEEDRNRLLGLSPTTPISPTAASAPPVVTSPAHFSPSPAVSPLGMKVSEAVASYVKEKAKLKEWDARTARQDKPKLILFADILGDPFMNTLTREHIRRYRDAMYELPRNMKKGKYAELAVKDILSSPIADEDKMKTTTIENNFVKVKSFIRWAKENELLPDDSIRSLLKVKKERRDSQLRTSFSQEDIAKIFSPETFLHPQSNRPWKFWVPVISLFSGARLEEICQLYLEDIVQEDGVWCFHFHDDGVDRRVKTLDSERFAPIHPFLLDDLNLQGYIKKLAKRREKRLFPDLVKRNDSDKYGSAVSKWFTKYRRNVGVHGTDQGKKVFHSFRNTVANWCDEHNIPEKKASRLVGHHHGTMTYGRYSNDTKPSLLYEEIIAKLNFGVDLSHLKDSPFVEVR